MKRYNITSSYHDRDEFERDMYSFIEDVLTNYDTHYLDVTTEDLLETLERIFFVNDFHEVVDDSEAALARFLDIGLEVRRDLIHELEEYNLGLGARGSDVSTDLLHELEDEDEEVR